MKRKKRRKEKKRSEEKNVLPRFELGPFGAPGESFTTRPRATSFVEILLLKPSSLMKHEFKKIFFRRMTSVWTVKTQRKSILSHLRVKNGSQTV